MAKFSAFHQYGNQKNKEEQTSASKGALEGSIWKPTAPDPSQEEINLDELVKAEPAKEKKKKKNTESPTTKNSLARTYIFPEEVVDALEEKFFKERKTWSPSMSFSKYISNLIWEDTHGKKLFDPETGKKIE